MSQREQSRRAEHAAPIIVRHGSQALSDPRLERAANLQVPAEHGRCGCCYAPLKPARRRDAAVRWCTVRCRMFAWRRGGDPDGPLVFDRARPPSRPPRL